MGRKERADASVDPRAHVRAHHRRARDGLLAYSFDLSKFTRYLGKSQINLAINATLRARSSPSADGKTRGKRRLVVPIPSRNAKVVIPRAARFSRLTRRYVLNSFRIHNSRCSKCRQSRTPFDYRRSYWITSTPQISFLQFPRFSALRHNGRFRFSASTRGRRRRRIQ